MNTQKIQITLTPQEVASLSIKSKALGYNVTKYIKYIVTREAEEIIEEYPTYKMSAKTEKIPAGEVAETEEVGGLNI